MRALEPLGISYSEHPGKRHLGPEQWQSGMKRKADTDLEDSTVKSWQSGSEDPRISEVGQREVPGPQQQQDSKLVGVDNTVGVEPVHEKSYGDKVGCLRRAPTRPKWGSTTEKRRREQKRRKD